MANELNFVHLLKALCSERLRLNFCRRLKHDIFYSGLSTESSTPGGWMSGSYPMSRKHSELINSPPPSRKLSTSPTFNR